MEVIIAYISLLIGLILVLMTVFWDWIYNKYIIPIITVKVYVGGMIPNKTRLTIIENYHSSTKNVLVDELCDENGEFHFRLPKKYVGRKLRFPIRHAGFLFNHEEFIIVQKWGYFEAIKMVKNRVYSKDISNRAELYIDKGYASEKYFEALYKSQYLARNQINSTKWFFMAAGVSVVASLIALGVVWWLGILIAVAAWAIRAIMKNRALGLSDKPIN